MWPMILLGAASAGSAIFQGITKSGASKAEADRLRQEAEIKREEAQLTKRSLFDRARRTEKQGQAFVGSQKAGFAGSGVSVTEGSPLAIMRESQKSIQQDVSRTRSQGESAFKLGLRQADVMDQQAQFADKYSAQQAIGGAIGAGTSFLGGLVKGSIYENYWATGSQSVTTPSATRISRNPWEL